MGINFWWLYFIVQQNFENMTYQTKTTRTQPTTHHVWQCWQRHISLQKPQTLVPPTTTSTLHTLIYRHLTAIGRHDITKLNKWYSWFHQTRQKKAPIFSKRVIIFGKIGKSSSKFVTLFQLSTALLVQSYNLASKQIGPLIINSDVGLH